MIVPELRIPLLVDAITILTVVFGGGVLYQKVSGMEEQMQKMQSTVHSIETNGVIPSAFVDRLARIEERQILIQGQLKDLNKQVRAINGK